MKNWKLKTGLFIGSQGISLFGSSVVQFAIIWYVTKETSSGMLVSLLTLCSFIPQMLVSLVSGAWADRHSKKLIIILADAAIASATLVLALVLPYIHNVKLLIKALMITSVIRSIGTGIQQPAVNAFLPEIVSQDKLMKVNGINSVVQSVVQFAAPAAAGALLSVSVLRNTLFIDISTAAAAIGLFFFIRVPDKERKEDEVQKTSVFEDIELGAAYTFKNKFFGKLLIIYGVFIFLCVPAGFMASLFVTRTYGAAYFNMSIVEITGFAGMMAGGILISSWGGFKNRMKTLVTGMFAFGVLAVGMGAVKNFIVYLILMAVYGIALTMVQTASTTIIQEKADADMQGRVFGFMNTLYSGFLPLGMAVFGPLADAVRMDLIMIVSGVLLAVMALCIRADANFYISGEQKDSQH